MDLQGGAAQAVQALIKDDVQNLVDEGETVVPVQVMSDRPSLDTQNNYEVIQSPEPEPNIVEETPFPGCINPTGPLMAPFGRREKQACRLSGLHYNTGNCYIRSIYQQEANVPDKRTTPNDDNGGSLVVVEEQPVPPDFNKQPNVVEEWPTKTKEVQVKDGGAGGGETKVGDVQTSLIQVQLQIDASMDNDELEAVRQTMTFVLGFYRKWHEEHYHRNKALFEFGKAAIPISDVPKMDECLPEFHARVEGVATSYASRLAQVALQIEKSLMAKAAINYQKILIGSSGDRSETDIWLAFREQADTVFKSGESWEKFVVILLFAYLVCLSEEVRSRQRATGFLRSFIQYLVADRHIRWVARHGGWANAAWGLRRQRLAKCLCAKSTMYGFILITVGVAAVGIFLTKKHHTR